MAQAIVRTTGEVPIEGRAAVPVYLDPTLPAVGPARNVIFVTSGWLGGGPAQPIVDMTGVLPGVGPALPVYLVVPTSSAADMLLMPILTDSFDLLVTDSGDAIVTG